jgi:hypothetical protein
MDRTYLAASRLGGRDDIVVGMGARLRRSLAGMLFILFLGVGVFWVRSLWIGDRVVVTSYRGAADRGQDFQNEIITWRGSVILVRRWYPDVGDVGEPSIDYYSDEGTSISIFEFNGGKLRFGFGAVAWRFGQGGGSSDGSKPNTETNAVFPMWFMELVLGIAPALWLRGVWVRTRGARWDRRGLCVKCGYDLRASSQICPECGEAIRRDLTYAQENQRGRESFFFLFLRSSALAEGVFETEFYRRLLLPLGFAERPAARDALLNLKRLPLAQRPVDDSEIVFWALDRPGGDEGRLVDFGVQASPQGAPAPVLCVLDHIGGLRVTLHVAADGQEMGVGLHRETFVAALVEVAFALRLRVSAPSLRVSDAEPAHEVR